MNVIFPTVGEVRSRYRAGSLLIRKFRRLGGGLVLSLLAISASGAAVPAITSKDYDAGSVIPSGIVYALPRKLAIVSFTREKVDFQKLIQAQAKAQATLTEASTTLEAKKKKVTELEAQVGQATDVTAKDTLEKALMLAKIEQRVAEIEADAATVGLADATTALQVLKDGQFRDTLSVAVQPAVPDAEHVFVASPGHSKWRTDTFNLKTTEAGLLEGYVGTAADKTGEVIVKTIEAARNLIALGSGGMGFRVFKEAAKDTAKPFRYERLFDPADPADVAAVNKDLADRLAGCYLVVTPSGLPATCKPDAPVGPYSGLVYRRPVQRTLVAYDISGLPAAPVTDGDAAKGRYLQSISLLLPNGGPIAVLDLNASRMVTTEFDFAFKDGMLISFKSVRPSEALAWATLIPDVLKAIVAIPTELIQLKIDYSTKDKAKADATKANLDSQVELLKAQQAFDAAKKADSATTTTTP